LAAVLLGLGACTLGDLFSDVGARAVLFEWIGDTVVSVGARAPVIVAVRVEGTVTPGLTIELEIPDTTNLKFGATHDTIVGLRPGHGDVIARTRSSLSPAIDSVFRIRVRP
jgi:hypothetical protein